MATASSNHSSNNINNSNMNKSLSTRITNNNNNTSRSTPTSETRETPTTQAMAIPTADTAWPTARATWGKRAHKDTAIMTTRIRAAGTTICGSISERALHTGVSPRSILAAGQLSNQQRSCFCTIRAQTRDIRFYLKSLTLLSCV